MEERWRTPTYSIFKNQVYFFISGPVFQQSSSYITSHSAGIINQARNSPNDSHAFSVWGYLADYFLKKTNGWFKKAVIPIASLFGRLRVPCPLPNATSQASKFEEQPSNSTPISSAEIAWMGYSQRRIRGLEGLGGVGLTWGSPDRISRSCGPLLVRSSWSTGL